MLCIVDKLVMAVFLFIVRVGVVMFVLIIVVDVAVRVVASRGPFHQVD